MTSLWSRSHLRYLWLSGEAYKRLDTLSQQCWPRCGCLILVWGWTTARTFNSVVEYIISLRGRYLAISPHHGCVNLSSLICVSWNLSMRCYTIVEIVPITQPGLSSSLSLPSSVLLSASSSSSKSSPSSEVARLLWFSLIVFDIATNVV